MKKVCAFVAGIMLACNAFAQNGLAHPESLNSDGHFLYATNIGKEMNPADKDGDGFISKLSLQGKMITPSITTEKLNAPKGTAIINGVLYVTDVDRIVGIALSTGKKTKEISLAAFNTSFANDLAVKDDHTLFVSLSDIGKVLEVDLNSAQIREVADLKGANGICYDRSDQHLYTCNFLFENIQGGEIGMITWQQGKPVYERIGDVHGGFDGLELINSHTLLVSDWGALDHPAGFLEKIDLDNKTATKLDLPVIGGPADIHLDAKQQRIYIPVMLESKVQTVKL
ncbi:hypothetical protein F0L74_30285 [Chitinophaga agrisoli]|uniref:ATP/GTP-binding protein n=1 Tax=Chitinophaga agrisoli TaxID=2607653 RepID=A0A5B2VLK2_9BACT|nr:hypothetical protein [Chitinophaga agrisoli]KAA2240443.1 hypothetical protein F0L74_30285 [Chitinophaga agrisoli]